MASTDESDTSTLNPEQKRNLVLRTHGAMTSLGGHPATGQVWIVLVPGTKKNKDDWQLLRAREDGDPSDMFVFSTRRQAESAALGQHGAIVEGGWPPIDGKMKEVQQVIVYYTDNTSVPFPGDEYDAVFWGLGARQKFLAAYYGMTGDVTMATMMQSTTTAIGHKRWCSSEAP